MNIDTTEYDCSDAWAQNDNEFRQATESALLAADPGYAKFVKRMDQLQRKHEMELNDSMTFDQLVPSESKYLKKEDVGEAGLILTIAGFTRELLEADGNQDEKTIIHFTEDVKPMVLNQTNAKLIPIVTGAMNAGDAKGKQVVVYNDPTISFGSKITGGLRIKSAQTQQPAQAPQSGDVPF